MISKDINYRDAYHRACIALKALVDHGRHCAFCGDVLRGDKEVKEHMEVCEKHPIAQLRVENKALRETLYAVHYDIRCPQWALDICKKVPTEIWEKK